MVTGRDLDPTLELEEAILRECGRVRLQEGGLDRVRIHSAGARLSRLVARYCDARDWFTGVWIFEPVTGKRYLEKVWEVVGRTVLENVLGAAEGQTRNGLAGAFQEDAWLTALFLWTFQATTNKETSAGPDNNTTVDEEEDAEEGMSAGKAKGFLLVFDIVRRFAQPLVIGLPQWEKRTIEAKRRVVRLLPVTERAQQLFGERGAQAVAVPLEQKVASGTDPLQGVLFSNRQEKGTFAVWEQRPRYGDADALPRRPCHDASRHDETRPGPHGDAAPGERAGQCNASVGAGGAGARPQLPAPAESALCHLSTGQRGEAPARHDTFDGSDVTGFDEGRRVR